MLTRENARIPIFTKEIMASIAKFLPPDSLIRFARTCQLAKQHLYTYLQATFNSSYLLLKFVSLCNAKLIARFLERFFWGNQQRENALISEIEKNNNSSAHALYALFAPRDHVLLNVGHIQDSIVFLLVNGFVADSALIRSLVFLVTISTGEFNVDLLPNQSENFHINLRGAMLDGKNLAGRFLAYANLSDASLKFVNCRGTQLNHANLQRAILNFAFFPKANLQHANLSCATAKQASFYDADMQHANILNADLSGAVMPRKPSAVARPVHHITHSGLSRLMRKY